MTVRELLQALEGVSPDALVEMEVWDDNCQGGEYCGESAEMGVTDIGSVNYDAETGVVTLREAL